MGYLRINNSVKRVLVFLISITMLLNYNMYIPAMAASANPSVETPLPTEASAFTIESGILAEYVSNIAKYSSIAVVAAEINSEKITGIKEEAFQYSSELETVVIPSTVTSIEEYAFASCYNLKDVYFYGDVGKIDGTAFGCEVYGDTSTGQEIVFHCKPEYLEKFKAERKNFYGDITIKADVKSELKDPAYPKQEEPEVSEKDGSDAAFFSYDVRSSEDGNKVVYINGYKAEGTGGEITLPSEYIDAEGNKYAVKGIAKGAFSGTNGSIPGVKDTTALAKITKIIVPAEIDDIEDLAFSGVGKYANRNAGYNLKEIEFKGDAVNLGISILSNNPKLEKVVFSSGLKTIPNYTFSKCGKLSDVNIPETVERIGYAAFKDCVNLHKIRFESALPPEMILNNDTFTKAWPFAGCKALTLEAPKANVNAYKESWKQMLSEKDVKVKGDISLVGWGEEGSVVVSIPDFKVPVGEDESKYLEYRVIDFDNDIKTGNIELKYVGYNGQGTLTIPEDVTHKVEGSDWNFKVIGIGEEAINTYRLEGGSSNYFFTKITFPNSLTYIRKGGCWSLGEVDELDFSKTKLNDIGKFAFHNCKSVKTVKLPATLENMGHEIEEVSPKTGEEDANAPKVNYTENVFSCCDKLENIFVDQANPAFKDVDGVLFTKDCKKLIRYPNAKKAAHYDIPAGVEVIASEAFRQSHTGSSVLETVSFPASLKEIESIAFRYANLKSLKLPANIKFGNCAFDLCKNLETVEIPEGVAEISDYMFWRCEKFSDVKLPASLKKIGKCAFESNPVKTVDLNNVEEVGDYAFNRCKSLTEVKIPATAKVIGTGVFADCSNLTKVEMEDGCKTIGRFMLFHDDKISELKIPDSVSAIGEYAFALCYGLKKINIPKNLSEMGGYTLKGCVLLENVVFPEEVTIKELPEGTFHECVNLKSVSLGHNIVKTGPVAFSGTNHELVVNCCADESAFSRSPFDNYAFNLDNKALFLKYADTGEKDANGYPIYKVWIKPDYAQGGDVSEDECKVAHIAADSYPQFVFASVNGELDPEKLLNIPDENLRDCILKSVLNAEREPVKVKGQAEEYKYPIFTSDLNAIEAAEALELNGWGKTKAAKQIKDLTGIEKFKFLKTFVLRGAKEIKTVDLTANKELVSVTISDCELKYAPALNGLTKLEVLKLVGNKYKTLDLSSNMNLKEFQSTGVAIKGTKDDYEGLTEIDLSNNTKLEKVNLSQNQLTALDVSKLKNMNELLFSWTHIEKLNLEDLTALERVTGMSKQLKEMSVKNNPNLTGISVNDSGLEKVTFKNNPKLANVALGRNKALKSLDISDITSLKELELNSSGVTALDVSKNTMLKGLNIGQTPIKELNVSNNKELEKFIATGSGLENLNLSGLDKLDRLEVRGDKSLDFSGKLKTLVLKGNSKLRTIEMGDNQVKTLDIQQAPILYKLSASNNKLESLDAKGLKLSSLNLDNNALKTIDLKDSQLSNPNSAKIKNQNIVVKQKVQDNAYIVKMADIVGSENVADIKSVEGADYDKTTGTVKVSLQNPNFKYIYRAATKTDWSKKPFDMELEVNVKVEKIEEQNSNTVDGSSGSGIGSPLSSGTGSATAPPAEKLPVTLENPEVPKSAAAPAFEDISGKWYEDVVKKSVEMGIFKGVSGDKFAPETPITRGMTATILGRFANAPETAEASIFKDVDNSAYYAPFVTWCNKNGIVKGISSDKFAPNDNVTREQIAAIVGRYIESKGKTLEASKNKFVDDAKISDYAKNYVYALANAGILKGDDKNNFRPTDNLTRAEAAAIIVRATEYLTSAK